MTLKHEKIDYNKKYLVLFFEAQITCTPSRYLLQFKDIVLGVILLSKIE